MRYIVEISPETDIQIRNLIIQQKYLNPYQFIERAIEELLHIEEQEISTEFSGLCARGDEPAHPINLRQLDSEPESLAEPHKLRDLWDKKSGDIPWLWGQINSVLCIKFVLRVIAARQQEKPSESLLLEDVRGFVADVAVRFCQQLDTIDRSQRRVRGERFSISFPKDSEKSKSRFLSQYLGYLDSKNHPKGALAWLGFARISGSRKNGKIALTPAGFYFGKLENLLIDRHSHETPGNALSDEEVGFYISHVMEHSPCEQVAFKTICKLISEGNDTPQSLDVAVKATKPEWSEAEAVTYKGGALARMYQLGIITKAKTENGTVQYKNTELAKSAGLI